MLRERLYVITDRRLTADLADHLDRLLDGAPAGSVLVQLREKDLDGRALFALAEKIRAVTARHQTRLLINDRIDVALTIGADGVHLPENGLPIAAARALLGPQSLIGASTHSPEDALAAAAADLVTIGPIWETPSKTQFGVPLGLRVACRPNLFALGGIDNLKRGEEVMAAEYHGVAVVRALMTATDPAQTCRSWVEVTARERTASPR